MTLSILKQRATDFTSWLGHTLTPFDHSSTESLRAYTSCSVCGTHLTVAVHPHPGSAMISGQAVEIACTGIQTPIIRKV